jgi:hypothetical protein
MARRNFSEGAVVAAVPAAETQIFAGDTPAATERKAKTRRYSAAQNFLLSIFSS